MAGVLVGVSSLSEANDNAGLGYANISPYLITNLTNVANGTIFVRSIHSGHS